MQKPSINEQFSKLRKEGKTILTSSNLETSQKLNLYFEYGKWVLFWGLFLDGRDEVQKVFDEYNLQGWHCVQFEWNSIRKYTLVKNIFIFLTTLITLGIFSHWSGFSIVFEKESN